MDNNPLRVLHIVGPMNRGGIENFLMNIYRKIDREKVQFDFLVTREEKGVFDDEIISLGGRVFYIPHITKVGLFRYINNISNFLEKNKNYKILHSHMMATSGIFLPIAKKKDIPVRISHGHSAPINQKPNSILQFLEINFKKILKYFTVKYSTFYFACSYAAGAWLFGNKVADNKMIIINNSIDAERFRYNENISKEIRRELLIPEDFLIIGHVGNMHSVKNHKFIIDIFETIYKQMPNSLLCLVGDGKLRHDIEEQVRLKGLENNVKLLGSRSNVNELMQAMDVFVFPSLFEGLPVTLIEAQASGLKCIASNTITDEVKITDLVEFISLDQSPEYWAEQVLKYANDYERKNTYKEICKAGYDVKENVKWLENFYLEEYNKISLK